MPREHGESGEYVETVTLGDVLDTFDHVEGPAVLSADVADRLGCSRETARRKLEALHDRGDLRRRKVSRRVIYWRPESGQERRETTADPDTVQTPTPTPNAESEDTRGDDGDDDDDDLAEDVRAYLDRNDVPPKTDHGRAAVVDVFRYLREQGTAKTGDIQDAVYPAYSDDWSDKRTMWNALDRYLDRVPGVEKGGYGEWTYAGDESVRETLAAGGEDESGIYDPTEEF